MKRTITLFFQFLIAATLLSGCATIVGGSKYNAHVMVTNRPNAKIIYNGVVRGKGQTVIKINRRDANKISFIIKEDDLAEQRYSFRTRSFRGWAFVGSALGWTGQINGFYVPWGIIVDLITGALWKPNDTEMGVSQLDYKNFSYYLTYDVPPAPKAEEKKPAPAPIPVPTPAPQVSTWIDVVYLKNGSIVRGIIIEQVPNVQLKIQTADKSLFVFKMAEVEKLAKEEQTK